MEELIINEIENGIYDVVLINHYISDSHVKCFGYTFLEMEINTERVRIKINSGFSKRIFELYREYDVNASTGEWKALIKVFENEIIDYFPFRFCEKE